MVVALNWVPTLAGGIGASTYVLTDVVEECGDGYS